MAEETKTWECGSNNSSNVIATLKGTTLTISGEGYMDNYRYFISHSNKRIAPWYGESITSVVIEDGVEDIGEAAFKNCIGLHSVIIAESVTSIGIGAFANCSALERINIPKSVEHIGYNAFSGCKTLKTVTIPCDITISAFRNCESLTTINIMDGVRGLGLHWYSNDGSLVNGCSSLETIVNENLVPQNISGKTFEDDEDENRHYRYVKLYVPASALNAYRKAPHWSNFKTILPIEDIDNCRNAELIDEEIENLERKKADIEQQIEKLRFKKAMMRGLKGNPKHVAEFMSLFNQRDGLKYLTHDMDESGDFDYEAVLNLAQKVCTENFEEMEIPLTLKELLNQFVFEENPMWNSFDSEFNETVIESGWSSDDWEEGRNSKIHPIKIPQFAKIIRNFKRVTRIESPYLERLANKVFADDDFEIEQKDLSKADFYTHVGEFKTALETIFSEIQKRSNSPDKKKVSVEYKRDGCDDPFLIRKIIITHHNSFPTRNDKEALIKEWLSFEKGSMAKIAEHLQGYCHWSVETCIEDEPVRVNILREKETEPHEAIDAADGFTHILTFYYQS